MGIDRYKEAYIQLNLMAHDLERDIHNMEDFGGLSEAQIEENKKYISKSKKLLETTKNTVAEIEYFEAWLKLNW